MAPIHTGSEGGVGVTTARERLLNPSLPAFQTASCTCGTWPCISDHHHHHHHEIIIIMKSSA
eukprot:scaffold97_cov261-Pinguiococcus_pyrenoidosus.AAC.12